MFHILLLLGQLTGAGNIGVGPALPSTCSAGAVFVTYNTPTLSVCTANNTWTSLATAAQVVPSGSLLLITSGTCPTGFTESSGLNGKMLRGTIAANGDVGTTAGNDTITPTISSLTAAAQIFSGGNNTTSAVSGGTPAGTNSALTFTGSAWTPPVISYPANVPTNANESSHTHTLTPLGSNAATATTGNCAATNVAIGTGATNACKATAPNLTVPAETFTGSSTTTAGGSAHTHVISWPVNPPTIATYTPTGTINTPTFTGSALSTHTHTVTPTGTNGTSAVTGTLNSFDNRPAYMNVIFCSKN